MKNYIIFWLMCGGVVVYGQSPPWFEATSNQVAAGVVGAPFAVTPRGLAGAGIGSPTNGVTAAQVGTQIASTNDTIIKAAITNTSSLVVGLSNNIVQMSAASGGNTYDDMRSASNLYPRHALGVSYTGDNGAALWASITGPGLGSNVWGIPIELPGGGNLGNPFWQDLPKVPYLDQGVYFGMGPHASMLTNAWPNGLTNSSVQPGFIVQNGNPFSGMSYINIRAAFTNSSYGSLVGTTADGITNVYVPTFGLQIGMIGGAYGNPTNGVIDQLGKYSQQAPSYQGGLLNNYLLNYYISENGHRSGDAPYGGQDPLFTIETDKFLNGDNEIIAGFPVQLANVWDVRQSAWLWALSVDERTSSPTVSTTNSLLQTGTTEVFGPQTNKGTLTLESINPGAAVSALGVNSAGQVTTNSVPGGGGSSTYSATLSGTNVLANLGFGLTNHFLWNLTNANNWLDVTNFSVAAGATPARVILELHSTNSAYVVNCTSNLIFGSDITGISVSTNTTFVGFTGPFPGQPTNGVRVTSNVGGYAY